MKAEGSWSITRCSTNFRGMNTHLAQMSAKVREFSQNAYLWLGVLFVLSFAVRLDRLTDPLTGYFEHRTTQTAFGIKSLAETTLNPFVAEMPALGSPWKVPFEFPLYQFVAALLVRTQLFKIDQAGRIVSILSLTALAYFVFKIAGSAHGKFIGLLGVAIVLFSSYGLLVGSEVLIDGFAVALSVCAYWLVSRWKLVAPDLLSVVLVCAAVALSALVKLNTAAIWVLGSVVLLAFNHTIERMSRVVLTGLLGVSLIPSLIWTSFADHVKSENRYTQWLVSSELNEWHFGTAADRFDFASIANSLSRFTQATVGGTVCFILLVFFALIDKTKRVSSVSSLIVVVSGPLLFIRLYNVHSYYWMAVLPAAVLLVCAGFSTIGKFLTRYFAWQSFRFGALFLTCCLIFSTYLSNSGSEYMNIFIYRRPLPVAAAVISENTELDDLIIVIGDDWSPATLYFSGRRGLTLRPGAPKPEPSELGTTYSHVYSWESNPAWEDYFPADVKLVEVGDHLFRFGE